MPIPSEETLADPILHMSGQHAYHAVKTQKFNHDAFILAFDNRDVEHMIMMLKDSYMQDYLTIRGLAKQLVRVNMFSEGLNLQEDE